MIKKLILNVLMILVLASCTNTDNKSQLVELNTSEQQKINDYAELYFLLFPSDEQTEVANFIYGFEVNIKAFKTETNATEQQILDYIDYLYNVKVIENYFSFEQLEEISVQEDNLYDHLKSFVKAEDLDQKINFHIDYIDNLSALIQYVQTANVYKSYTEDGYVVNYTIILIIDIYGNKRYLRVLLGYEESFFNVISLSFIAKHADISSYLPEEPWIRVLFFVCLLYAFLVNVII